MSEESRKILEMVSNGTVSVQEAEQLLQAVGGDGANGSSSADAAGAPPANPRYFRITVNKPPRDGKKAETVNIKVPISVVRGGLRLSALFPGMLGKKKIQLDNGSEIDLSKVSYADLEAMIKDIGELTVDVDGGDAQVRIRTE